MYPRPNNCLTTNIYLHNKFELVHWCTGVNKCFTSGIYIFSCINKRKHNMKHLLVTDQYNDCDMQQQNRLLLALNITKKYGSCCNRRSYCITISHIIDNLHLRAGRQKAIKLCCFPRQMSGVLGAQSCNSKTVLGGNYTEPLLTTEFRMTRTAFLPERLGR